MEVEMAVTSGLNLTYNRPGIDGKPSYGLIVVEWCRRIDVMQTKKTDLQVLRALLSMPAGKLSQSEKRVFQEMYDKVATGFILRLSPKQRIWADSVYNHHDLDKERAPVKVIPIRDKSLEVKHPLDKMARPLKPPGKH